MKMRYHFNMYTKEYEYKNPKYLAWLKENKPCEICGNYGVEIHHIKKMPLVRKRNDLMCIPLCPEHHRGEYSPHGFKSVGFYAGNSVEWQMTRAVLNFSEYEATS